MPKVVDLAAQRRTITNAAIAVIDASGLDGARLRDVARAASVTTGAVTHYFDGKDAVLEAALQEIVRRTLARLDRASERPAAVDVPAFIEQVTSYLPIDEAGRQEWRVWLAFWGRAISDPRLRAVHQGYYSEIVDRMIPPLHALRPTAPKPTRRRVRKCADALVAAIDGVGARATLEPDLWPAKRQKETLEELIEPMLTAFVRGTDPA